MNTYIARSSLVLALFVGAAGCQNSETAKGDANETKGKVEQAAGDITGSDSLKAAGKADKTKGKVQKGVGSVEHAVNP
jgi:uncharacterized protein YjbJ (UPF0337 family)